MPSQLAQEQNELLAVIFDLNFCYDEVVCAKLVDSLNDLVIKTSFREVKSWLEQVNERENLPVIYGLIGILYFQQDFFQTARDYAALARDNSAVPEVWSDLIKDSILCSFQEQKNLEHITPQ